MSVRMVQLPSQTLRVTAFRRNQEKRDALRSGKELDMPAIRMLVVDDNEHFRFLATQAARADGRVETVGEACQGVDAITISGQLRPDVVLLDLHMPTMDGLEAIQGIRGVSPGSKILAWSGLDDSFGDDAVALGADAHLSKGVPVSRVIDCVVALAGSARQEGNDGDVWLGAYLLKSLTEGKNGAVAPT